MFNGGFPEEDSGFGAGLGEDQGDSLSSTIRSSCMVAVRDGHLKAAGGFESQSFSVRGV